MSFNRRLALVGPEGRVEIRAGMTTIQVEESMTRRERKSVPAQRTCPAAVESHAGYRRSEDRSR
jgi:hypothetical protein